MQHAPSPPEALPSWVLPLLGAGLPCFCTQGMDGQAAQGSSLVTGMPLRLMQVPGRVCRIRIPINKQCNVSPSKYIQVLTKPFCQRWVWWVGH